MPGHEYDVYVGWLLIVILISSLFLFLMKLSRKTKAQGQTSHIPAQVVNWYSPEGRLNRGKYWGLHGLILIMTVSIHPFPSDFQYVFHAFFIYINVIAHIKRFHDMDRPGSNAFHLLIPIYNLLVFYSLFSEKGTEGPNKYGSDLLGEITPIEIM